MGKKKIDQSNLIQNLSFRNVTYCKRKRGLIKKAMELSMLCDQSISILIYDKAKDKLVTYNSTEDFSVKESAAIEAEYQKKQNKKKLEAYTNNDYNNFVLSQTVSNCDIPKPVNLKKASKTQLKVI
jgi:hypothetical protein